ncbi:M20/M25/M40 family metallo-hydrolase [Streptomyces ureilyticus]|uniref:M20 family metallopeptidase n=1 Tax=Streptomyces ureilyticus TaxID=1775131 RepID=A0ABX0E021_9ACTN|nr:M20/M25/M40 family metallo-hydrolase [Streptomyces ureilyticus]NGO44686.1 M20 family metallopeptidase [Streptomyces ureilyticus]
MSDLFTGRHRKLLLDLLRLPSVNPLEAGPDDPPSRLPEILQRYATAAAEAGFRTLRLANPPAACLDRPGVPSTVRAAARDPRFLADQPSLLLRLGPERPRAHTVMFNVHLDTVAGHTPPAFDGVRFTGRGAVDAKGPAVALLAGLRAAASHPAVGRDVTVLLQAVAGEEGGALGTYGTRPLLEDGHHGRLNVFCEPTALRALPRATAAMTARITVSGEDAVDDHPDAGHNATVLLGFLSQHLAACLDGAVPGTRVCVAGLHTGRTHNRVHGTGTLLMNLSYRRTADGDRLKTEVTRHVADGLRRFTELFAHTREFARTARDAARITRLGWDKEGLPALDDSDPWAEELLARAGARPAAGDPGFTCDAIWAAGLDDAFTTVLGPGCLAANRAHAPGEYVDLADLEEFAGVVRRLVTFFAEAVPTASAQRPP